MSIPSCRIRQTFRNLLKVLVIGLVIFTFILIWRDSYFQVPDVKPDVFAVRRNYVREMCRKYNDTAMKTVKELFLDKPATIYKKGYSIYQMKRWFVDSYHKVMYCYVPKAGCTNWKRVMMMLRGTSNASDPLEIPRNYVHNLNVHLTVDNLSPIERLDVLQNYKKFMVVRDPFERILSAYRNKFESKTAPSGGFHQKIGKEILKKYRPNATQDVINAGNSVTFLEFITYMTEPNKINMLWDYGHSYNEHWEPINGLCSPCTIDYDYIIHFENLVDESNEVLRRLHADGIKFPEEDVVKPSGTREKMRQYYEQIPLKNLKILQKMFNLDNLFFNYSSDDLMDFD